MSYGLRKNGGTHELNDAQAEPMPLEKPRPSAPVSGPVGNHPAPTAALGRSTGSDDRGPGLFDASVPVTPGTRDDSGRGTPSVAPARRTRDARTDARLMAFTRLLTRRAEPIAEELQPQLVRLVNGSMKRYLREGNRPDEQAQSRYRRCLVKARDAENPRQVARAIGKLTPDVVSNQWFVIPTMDGGYAMSDLVALYRLAGHILTIREEHVQSNAYIRSLLRARLLEPDEAASLTVNGTNAINPDGTIKPLMSD